MDWFSRKQSEPIKLYYSPGSCALATHAYMIAANIPYTLEKVNLRTKEVVSDGSDYLDINPNGAVPYLTRPDGFHLSQHFAIASYLSSIACKALQLPDMKTEKGLRVAEAMGFAADLQSAVAPIFGSPNAEAKAAHTGNMDRRLIQLEDMLAATNHKFWLGDEPTYPDFEVGTILGWLDMLKIERPEYERCMTLKERVRALPAFQQALEEEGLKK